MQQRLYLCISKKAFLFYLSTKIVFVWKVVCNASAKAHNKNAVVVRKESQDLVIYTLRRLLTIV